MCTSAVVAVSVGQYLFVSLIVLLSRVMLEMTPGPVLRQPGFTFTSKRTRCLVIYINVFCKSSLLVQYISVTKKEKVHSDCSFTDVQKQPQNYVYFVVSHTYKSSCSEK